MTTRPRLYTDASQVVGLIALALFAVLAAVFVTADFGQAAGFGGKPVTASLGYAMFDLEAGALPSEGFLVPFEIIDVVLVAALVGSVMLASREGAKFSPLSAGKKDPSDPPKGGPEEHGAGEHGGGDD